jgi:hypothetical protein
MAERRPVRWEVGNINGDKGRSLSVKLVGDDAGAWTDIATGEVSSLSMLIMAIPLASGHSDSLFDMVFRERGHAGHQWLPKFKPWMKFKCGQGPSPRSNPGKRPHLFRNFFPRQCARPARDFC